MSGGWGSRRCITGLFMVAEVGGGIVSGSLALLADAGHMLTDFASLSLAWFGFRLARRPADWRRTYGFDRFQVLVAFTNGLALFAIAAWIVFEAIERLSAASARRRRHHGGGRRARPLVNIGAFACCMARTARISTCSGAAVHVLGDLLGSVAALIAGAVILRHRLDADRSAAVDPRRRHHRAERLAGGGSLRPHPARRRAARTRYPRYRARPRRQCLGGHRRASCACVVDHAGAAHGDAACLHRRHGGFRPAGQGYQAAR